MKKLVVSDIDNTLVVKHEPLSEYSKRMIKELKKQGFLFGLASGRSVGQLQVLAENWGIEADLIIGINGSEIYDGIKKEHRELFGMEAKWIEESIEIMSEFDTIPCGAYGDVWISLDNNTASDNSRKYLANMAMFKTVSSVDEFINYRMSKMCFRVKEEIMPLVEKKVSNVVNKPYKPLKTENTMMEFCNASASKGNALKIFLDEHNIDSKDVWAFGDMDNDLDMIELAGNGVCMLNGSEEVKKHADYITEKTISEDGWAYFVEKHLLNF